jgi:mannan endo-1,4-beta-mannosidase
VEWNGTNKRIIALTENGCLFDPDLAFRDNAIWSYFCTWQGEFVVRNNTRTLSEQYTESEMVKKVYTSDKVITLDELPDLRTYGD